MRLTTASGKDLHPIGIGTWTMGGEQARIVNEANDSRDIEAIRHSLDLGQNHIDTAEIYGDGHTDELVAQAISGFKREDIFIANKLWKNSFGEPATKQSVEQMCERLETDYIDLLYIHWTFDDDQWKKSIDPINRLIQDGKVRYFGVSNFTVDEMVQAQQLSSAPIAANQMEYNIMYRDEVDKDFKSFCELNGIQIVAYKPIDRGSILNNEAINEIAQKYNATPAQISLAWLLEQGTYPIPKASQIKHIDENFGAIKLDLNQEDIRVLDQL